MGLLGPQAHRAIGKHALFYTFGFDPGSKLPLPFIQYPASNLREMLRQATLASVQTQHLTAHGVRFRYQSLSFPHEIDLVILSAADFHRDVFAAFKAQYYHHLYG